MRFFEIDHLPEWQRQIVEPFHNLAWHIESRMDYDCEQARLALQKLKESMDCALSSAVLEMEAAASEDDAEALSLFEADEEVVH